jgi:hypothetical protein
MTRRHGLRTVVLLLTLAALGAASARATQTDPVLVVARARASAGATGTLVELDARFPQADLVQRAVPVQVVLLDGTGGFVRFPLGGTPVVGILPALADGLDADDVAGLLSAGAPLADARLLRLAARRIEVWLPAGAPVAPVAAQLVLVYEGDPILSNPAPLETSP